MATLNNLQRKKWTLDGFIQLEGVLTTEEVEFLASKLIVSVCFQAIRLQEAPPWAIMNGLIMQIGIKNLLWTAVIYCPITRLSLI